MEEPDPATVRAAAAGDVDAFEEIVRGCQADVWRFLRHLLGDPVAAEDVAQEAFINAYRRLHHFRFESRFSTWLLQIARNAAVDSVRRQARQLRVATVAPRPAPASDPVARAELHAMLAALSPKLREAIVLVEVTGLAYRDAARVLGVPEGTVKSRVFQARERLTDWIHEERAGEV